jgi:hypothetical protein
MTDSEKDFLFMGSATMAPYAIILLALMGLI